MTTSNGTLPAQIINLDRSRAWLLSAGEHSADGTGYEGYCQTEGRGQTGSGPPLAPPPRTPRLPKRHEMRMIERPFIALFEPSPAIWHAQIMNVTPKNPTEGPP